MTEDATLTAGRVQYLSFEGGGGKGAAYLGALAALAHPDVGLLTYDRGTDDYHLERRTDGAERGVAGVAGSSAGAITAALLASGWGLRALHRDVISDHEALGGFFDPAPDDHRLVPVATARPGAASASPADAPTGCVAEPDGSLDRLAGVGPLGRAYGRLRAGMRATATRLNEARRLLPDADGAGPARHPAVGPLWRHTEAHLRDLVADYGLFSGCAARTFVDRTVSAGRFVAPDTGRADGTTDRARNLTFAEHRRLTGVELVVTGTNLRTGRVAYLSARHGPADMAVADAVRISMGIPVVFKPVRVDHADAGWPRRYGGLWVDGGVLNNNPIHAFDDAAGGGDKGADGPARTPNVLGLRLGADEPNAVGSLPEYLGAVAKTYANAAETREIRTEREAARTVVLPVPPGTLGTLDFIPDEAAVRAAGVEAARAVLAYFGVDARPDRVFAEALGLGDPAAG
jgi:NTE family protein